ncbi:uracil-xanthine permease family protein [Paenibacillus riograndensis]|uniref:Putative membrane protein n=1 Tax=Paenibacillus riograndensis SBR5 TaxID=1073571 RepID=A0A0E3WHC5_9BACL|nr:solute carrier family 23 protein [Paenibacillus riograndensis]CQR55048.1 putative membrane protein [Paenibacillus riograndensis SBR5]
MHSTHSEEQVLTVGIEEKLSIGANVTYGFQHLLALTGIFLFPVLIGQALGLDASIIGYMIQACFLTTGIVTVLQSGKMLRLPVVQGPTAAFFVAVLSAGSTVGLGTAFGSMAVAGLIFMLLSIPVRRFGLIGYLNKFISPPIVYGTLLIIIGAQLADIGLKNWFGSADTGINFAASLVTVLIVLVLLIFGGNTILRRGALLWGIIAGTIFYSIFGTTNFSSVAAAGWFSFPDVFPFGFGVSVPIVILMLLAFLQASAEAVGMYTLLTKWGNQKLDNDRVNRGLFGEFLGSTLGAVFGGLGTTSYPENIGIVRVSGIGSRYVTMTAGVLAIVLGLIPKVGMFIASLPGPVLSAASTILFGIIAISGIQMVSKVVWDELNLVVAGSSFIISLGTMYLPAELTQNLPLAFQSIVTQPMLVGVVLLIVLNTVVNIWIRPLLERRSTTGVSEVTSEAV